ncbi:hypothetical protein TeGR_g3709 [Tetraparma gracilis]|jgi:hypothetical protein|uniref:Uncharacterized protein n=1 Tax=Tetraparma gracilis TaxID=2962635 RepID=A0ABQ6NB00_9STRA|nr:hypothetical protein TeGR_g3709 [Tetraparma gracilis]
MGTSRNAQLDLAFKLLNISGSLADTLEFAYDVTLWTLVCSGGLVYWAMGAANVFGGFCHYPQLCAFFGLVKLGVAASLLQIVSDGNAGPYTLLFGWAELGWAMGFFFWCKTVGFYAFKKDVGAKMGVSKSPATPTRRSSRNRSKKE